MTSPIEPSSATQESTTQKLLELSIELYAARMKIFARHLPSIPLYIGALIRSILPELAAYGACYGDKALQEMLEALIKGVSSQREVLLRAGFPVEQGFASEADP